MGSTTPRSRLRRAAGRLLASLADFIATAVTRLVLTILGGTGV